MAAQPCRWQPLLLLLLLCCRQCAALNPAFKVYSSCTVGGTQGQCRASSQPGGQQQTRAALQGSSGGNGTASSVAAAVPQQLAIDFSFPCSKGRWCAENVDAAEKPLQPPVGAGVRRCRVTLMPWSAFPCTFDARAYTGNATNLCYTSAAERPSSEPEYALAQSLTTDGYTNVFAGAMPEQLECTMPAAVAAMSAGGAGARRQAGRARAGTPAYGRRFRQVLLTLDFRVAAGRQFDRAYVLQIGQAVAAFGTLTEPTRFLGTDKQWRSVVDVTHLQAYFGGAGQPTRFSIGNLLSNTYNVPLWASASLEFFWAGEEEEEAGQAPPAPVVAAGSTVPQAAGAARVVAAAAAAVPAAAARKPAAVAAAAAPLGASSSGGGPGVEVPDEVVPLVVPGAPQGGEALASLSGAGDGRWPRVTFELPPSLSETGDIYRAQLLVVPKANGCEEFWAMNPSGPGTNNTCGGLSTGEPHREVRVWVNGQLAGFSPIFYTMYTGGIDPRLWQAVVAAYAYQLPGYTFDLSPWLPQLNIRQQQQQKQQQQGQKQQQQGLKGRQGEDNLLPATSRRRLLAVTPPAGPAAGKPGPAKTSAGAAGGAAASSDQRLPAKAAAAAAAASSAAGKQAATRQHTQPAPVKPQQAAAPAAAAKQPQPQAGGRQHSKQQQQKQQPASAGPHTITVELVGATGSDWILASTLLLWRAGSDANGQPITVTGDAAPSQLLSPGLLDASYARSECTPAGGASLADAGRCVLQLRHRSMLASAVLRVGGREYVATVEHATRSFRSDMAFNNSAADGSLAYDQRTRHEARWEVAPVAALAAAQQPSSLSSSDEEGIGAGGGGVLTQAHTRYDWTHAGGVATGAVYEISANATLLQPTVFAPPVGSVESAGRPTIGAGRQRHYQRAVMLSVYDQAHPTCPVSDFPSHNATLHSSIALGPAAAAADGRDVDGSARRDAACVSRKASTAFCSASLLKNIVDLSARGC